MAKVSFNQIYEPIKQKVSGELYRYEKKKNGETILKVIVTLSPNSLLKDRVILSLQYKNLHKSFKYKKTREEIKELVKDVKYFYENPSDFINQ